MNGKNSILHASLDGVLVDAAGEAERAAEFANATFADPELSVGGLGLDGLLVVGGRVSELGLGGFLLVLDGGFVGFDGVVFAVLDGAGVLGVFDQAGVGGGRGALDAAADGEG